MNLFVFLLLGGLLLCGWGFAWGFHGALDKTHFNLLLMALPPWQRQELADSLNHYYNTIVSKHTTGYVLRCDRSRESIKRQFNWFYRSAAGTMFNSMPDYDAVVRAAYKEVEDKRELPKDIPTWRVERMLENMFPNEDYDALTSKDTTGLCVSAASTAANLLISAVNPLLGLTTTAASAAYQSSSDPAKAIPGIIKFQKIRFKNFSICFLTSWAAVLLLFVRRGGGKKRRR